jgi:hypothetical protein
VVPTRGRERSIKESFRKLAGSPSRIKQSPLGQNVNSYRFGDWDFARLIGVADVPKSNA